MYRLVKEEASKHYMLTLCPAHKIELAISDAFKESALNITSIHKHVLLVLTGAFTMAAFQEASCF